MTWWKTLKPVGRVVRVNTVPNNEIPLCSLRWYSTHTVSFIKSSLLKGELCMSTATVLFNDNGPKWFTNCATAYSEALTGQWCATEHTGTHRAYRQQRGGSCNRRCLWSFCGSFDMFSTVKTEAFVKLATEGRTHFNSYISGNMGWTFNTLCERMSNQVKSILFTLAKIINMPPIALQSV